jgi:hypothetical protein
MPTETIIVNCETGEETVRSLTAEEQGELDQMAAVAQARETAAAQAAQDRAVAISNASTVQELKAALGLT